MNDHIDKLLREASSVLEIPGCTEMKFKLERRMLDEVYHLLKMKASKYQLLFTIDTFGVASVMRYGGPDMEITLTKLNDPKDIDQAQKIIIEDLKIRMNLQTFLPMGVPNKAFLGRIGIKNDNIVVLSEKPYFETNGDEEKHPEWFRRLDEEIAKTSPIDYGFDDSIVFLQSMTEDGQKNVQDVFLEFKDHCQ